MLMSQPLLVLISTTFVDVISSLDVDEHVAPDVVEYIPVLTSYPPWILTSTLPQMKVCPFVNEMRLVLVGCTGVTVKPSTCPVYENCLIRKYEITL